MQLSRAESSWALAVVMCGQQPVFVWSVPDSISGSASHAPSSFQPVENKTRTYSHIDDWGIPKCMIVYYREALLATATETP